MLISLCKTTRRQINGRYFSAMVKWLIANQNAGIALYNDPVLIILNITHSITILLSLQNTILFPAEYTVKQQVIY